MVSISSQQNRMLSQDLQKQNIERTFSHKINNKKINLFNPKMSETFKVSLSSEEQDIFWDLQMEKCLLIEESPVYQINDNLETLEQEIIALSQ